MVSTPGRTARAVAAPAVRQVKLGAYVTFEGRAWQVTAVAGASVRLVDEHGQTASVLASFLFADPTFAVVDSPTAGVPPWGLLEAVPDRERERALAWQRHIREIETGLPGGPGSGGIPRPEYDPERRSMAEREQAKADELAALGWPRVSRATVRRMRARYHAGGLMGLVPRRKPTRATGRADERVVAAVLEALRRQRGRSRGTLKGLRELTGQILADTHGPGAVALPTPSTFNRLARVLADPLEHPGRPARTATTTPTRPLRPTVALRPGELVQVDTTRLDVMAVGEDGRPVRPELTIALDVATRSVVAAVLREESTRAVDAALLLAEMAVPHPARPGWPGQLRLAHAAVPYTRLLALDSRLEQAAARPVVVPETIVIDRGRVFVSAAFLAACETLGVSVQPAPPRSPAAKGAVERTFGSINTLFAQHVAGYTGSHVLQRGGSVEDEARFTVAQLQELLDEWVTACWQHRPHDGLRHPVLPKKALAPNEMWGALLGASGYVPLPLTGADYLELLPVRFHPVTGRGIRINYRTYDHACLNEHRGRPSPTGPGGRWEVHLNPHDVRQIYIRLPDGCLHEVPWIHRDHVHAPMGETAWRHIRAAVNRRAGRERHEADLAEAADQVLRHARPQPAPAAPVAAAAAGATGPQTADDHAQAQDSLDAIEAHAPDADGRPADSDELSLPTGRFALYDAFKEAEHW
ncbi:MULTISPECIES: DDE-type integrase/transposase/recombinase [Streptomyces violaceusniger group]|uniref:DDE-type integrase/transposase/recombinase n=2 Tax=Streptomyces rhizosphaericus TaxID=114699 RepID=A0ABN1SP90_9ACTN|nr:MULTISPECIES: DDE-type integrase/transposase/recombinase [Streptomyces violaceusniger group]